MIVDLQPGRQDVLRDDVAWAVGIDPTRLVLEPAAPRQGDVTMFGRWCRTALATGDNASMAGGQSLALVDCRPILQGWALLFVQEGQVPYRELLDNMGEFAPPGWDLAFRGVEPVADMLALAPGQVTSAVYVRQLDDDEADVHEEDADDDESFGPNHDDHDRDSGSADSDETGEFDSAGSRDGDRESRGQLDTGSIVHYGLLALASFTLLRIGVAVVVRIYRGRVPFLTTFALLWLCGCCGDSGAGVADSR